MKRADFIATKFTDIQESDHLLYVSDGYKYQSRSDAVYQVFIYPIEDIITDLIILRRDGWMWVSKYFAWDGCSGPTWDDVTNMRAGHGHDALYALFRMGKLDPVLWRPKADAFLKRIMLKDGAWNTRAEYYEWAVNKFASFAADPKSQKKVLRAP